ncbi:hypothetical protein L7F22_010475 [Adiantum nelumboides]|nr:hypothetical protein [Adiantum nelumboides]
MLSVKKIRVERCVKKRRRRKQVGDGISGSGGGGDGATVFCDGHDVHFHKKVPEEDVRLGKDRGITIKNICRARARARAARASTGTKLAGGGGRVRSTRRAAREGPWARDDGEASPVPITSCSLSSSSSVGEERGALPHLPVALARRSLCARVAPLLPHFSLALYRSVVSHPFQLPPLPDGHYLPPSIVTCKAAVHSLFYACKLSCNAHLQS